MVSCWRFSGDVGMVDLQRDIHAVFSSSNKAFWGGISMLMMTFFYQQVLAVDLLNPTPQAEARKHKLKMLVPAPRSFFMDVKCPGCFTITTVFSHAQTVVICAGCSTVLCQPTGGKARLTEGCSFRRK
ncbi:40S ribosomal protein S27 [Emydomyces testavorans]|uniref:40S ribosomal protein S27 n=1 Tax=Emydomyces testavorans TaxID=2070801 RepID=A0AAF0DFB4_9EURO|nr:40S ribosomal protein S27 [Emydomyces testavorans]